MSFWFVSTNGKWFGEITSSAVENVTRLSPPESKTRGFLDQSWGEKNLIKAVLSDLTLFHTLPVPCRLLRRLKSGIALFLAEYGSG